MNRKFAFASALAALLVTSATVFAQTAGPNGGLLGGTGAHQTELVVSGSDITVFLLEDGKPHENKGTTLKAVVQQSGKSETVNFAVDGQKLVAKLPTPLAKGAIVVLTGKDSHGDVFNARYVIN